MGSESDIVQLARMAGAILFVAMFVLGVMLQLTYGYSERDEW